jgi:hypothetical protein
VTAYWGNEAVLGSVDWTGEAWLETTIRPVTLTNAWHDDDGHGRYVVRCMRERGPEMP